MAHTQQIHKAILSAGYKIAKTDEKMTGRVPVWQVLDNDKIPLHQSKWLGELCREFDKQIGGVL